MCFSTELGLFSTAESKNDLQLVEQNQCDFWVQHIKMTLKQLKNPKQFLFGCWPVLFLNFGDNALQQVILKMVLV